MKEVLKNYFSETSRVGIALRRVYNFIVSRLRNIIVGYIYSIMPINNKKIVICNYYGKGYGDNGKYICEEIIKQKHDFDIVWLVEKDLINKSDFPSNIRAVEYDSLKGLYELSTAKIWIDNSRKMFYPPKRRNQFYIQTWHGGVALKRIEKDAEKELSVYYVDSAKNDSKMADLFVSNSEFCTNLYKNSFWYQGEILEVGSPRCDILMKKDPYKEKEIRNKLALDSNTKIILYAPTFRKDERLDSYNIGFERLLKTAKEKWGGDWKVLIRLHPNISDKKDFMKYDTNIINVTDYPDMYELLKISDMLITDYSSSMFEFSYCKKPVFLYVPDLSEYMADRNFYFEIDLLPYKICENNDMLISSIRNFDFEKYTCELENFLNKLEIKECGEASYEVVKKINEIINL